MIGYDTNLGIFSVLTPLRCPCRMVLQDSVSVRLCQKHCVKALPCSLTHSHGVNNDDDDGGGDDDDDEKENH